MLQSGLTQLSYRHHLVDLKLPPSFDSAGRALGWHLLLWVKCVSFCDAVVQLVLQPRLGCSTLGDWCRPGLLSWAHRTFTVGK